MSTTVAFPQTCLAVLIPMLNPHRDSAAVNLQALGNLTGAIPIQAQENALNAQHYSRRLVLLSLSPQLQKLLNCPPIPFGKYVHICPASIDLKLQMSHYLCAPIKFRGTLVDGEVVFEAPPVV